MNRLLNFIREAREEMGEENLTGRILLFITLLLIGMACLLFLGTFVGLLYSFPRVCIPLYSVVGLLYWGYNRL